MEREGPCNFHLLEILSDAIETGAIEVGSKEHLVALLVAQRGLKSLSKDDRLTFEYHALPALLTPLTEQSIPT